MNQILEIKDCIFDLNAYHDASLAVKELRHDVRIMGFTRGRFSLIDLIRATVDKIGPSHILVATWSAGIKDINTVKFIESEGKVLSFRFLLDMSFETRKGAYALSLIDYFGKEAIRTTKLHAKYVLIFNEKMKVCMRTSMNLNANHTCENYEIDTDPRIFDFYEKFTNEFWEKMPAGFVQNFNMNNNVLKEILGETEKIKKIDKNESNDRKSNNIPKNRSRAAKSSDTSWRKRIF